MINAALTSLIDELSVKTDRITVLVEIVDESGSMERFCGAPQTETNDLLDRLRMNPRCDEILALVVTFSTIVRLHGGAQYVRTHPGLRTFVPDGHTKLYGSVHSVLSVLMEAAAYTTTTGARMDVILAVHTDGADDHSTVEEHGRLVELAKKARRLGWDLLTFAYGVDAAAIANDMGFPCDHDHAHTLTATPESFEHSKEYTFIRTVIRSDGRRTDCSDFPLT